MPAVSKIVRRWWSASVTRLWTRRRL
uniref:Uncharacterized protein n=1 Tax=Romanomermis culicivorax TaxID=13658 RepID=A0A915K1B2_ROMCU